MAKKSNIAPFLLLGGGALMLAMSRRKDGLPSSLGVDVSEGCANVNIVDMPSFEIHMLDVYTRLSNAGIADPFEIANAIVDTVSGACRKFPEDMRSSGELELYVAAVKFVTIESVRAFGADVVLGHPMAAEYGAWLSDQSKKFLTGSTDPAAIMFIQDGDDIRVGPAWIDDVFYPMMENVKENTPMLFTQGTALTLAAMVIGKTVFVDQDDNQIEVDLKSSLAGQKFLQTVTDMVKDYIAKSE